MCLQCETRCFVHRDQYEFNKFLQVERVIKDSHCCIAAIATSWFVRVCTSLSFLIVEKHGIDVK